MYDRAKQEYIYKYESQDTEFHMLTENEHFSCTELRARARALLFQDLKQSLLFNLLFFAILAAARAISIAPVIVPELCSPNSQIAFLVSSTIASVLAVLFYAIIASLRVGYSKFFLLRSRGEECSFKVLRDGCNKPFRNTFVILVADVIYFGLISLIIMLGFILLELLLSPVLNSGSAPINRVISGMDSYMKIAGAVVSAASIFFCSFLLLNVYAALELLPFHLADNPDMGSLESLKTLWAKTGSRNLQMLKLFFSFTGWWLLCIATFGIAAIWVIPYWNYARAEFYRVLSTPDHR